MQIGFIGAGHMAQAIISGIISNNIVNKDDILVNAKTEASLKNIEEKYDVSTTIQKKEVLRFSDIVILAVKPSQMAGVIREIKESVKVIDNNIIFLSLAAGITIEQLNDYFTNSGDGVFSSFSIEGNDTQVKLVRAMPNMPVEVGEGMTAISLNKSVKFSDIDKVVKIFNSIGKVEIVEERLMDAVVALSGSSPAYIYLVIEAMVKAAVAEGMKEDMAVKFAAQAILGSAKMVLTSRRKPAELRKEVCSPGGTTIEAINVLENEGMTELFVEAMEACINKSKSLT